MKKTSNKVMDDMVDHILLNYDLSKIKPSTKEFILNVNDYELFSDFKLYPDEFRSLAKKALIRALCRFYTEKIVQKNVTENDTLNMLVVRENSSGRIDKMSTAFHKINLRLHMNPTIKMNKITPDLERKPICFDCKITGIEEEKTYTKSCEFCCVGCDICSEKMFCDENRRIMIPRCPKCKTNMEPMESTIQSGAVQKIYLQERMEESENMALKQRDAKIYDDVVGTVTAGQDVRVIGIFKSIPNKKENDVIIDIVDAEQIEEIKPQMPTLEEIQKYKEDSKNPDFFDKVISYFNSIEGNELSKKIMILTVIGGIRVDDIRGTIHSFFIGDAATAKSRLMEKMKEITPKSIICTGMGLTSAGLTIGIVKEKNGTSHAELGVLALCNGGVAYVDEFDKTRKDDKENLLQGMEQQYVGIDKAGFHIKTPTVTTVIASANPQGGRWGKKGDSIMDNINISEPLLTRFDNVILLRDKVDDLNDTKIGNRILDQLSGNSEQHGCYMNKQQMCTFLNYVKTKSPKLSQTSHKKILEFFKKIRKLANDNDSIPISFRNLIGLTRMATAHAKLKSKDMVDEEDVDVAIQLYKDQLGTFGIDVDSGNVQEIFASTKELNKQETTSNCIRECENENGEFLLNEVIEKMANTKYFDEDSASKELQRWYKAVKIKTLNSGLWKRV